jgi:hypothetical protein
VRTRLSSATTRAARLGVCSHAGIEAADGDDLVPGPDSDGEGAGSAAQNGLGAIVEPLERWDDTATTDSDEGGQREARLAARWALPLTARISNN